MPDVESDSAKHSSELEAVIAKSTITDGESATLQSELGALMKSQLRWRACVLRKDSLRHDGPAWLCAAHCDAPQTPLPVSQLDGA